MPQCEWVIGLLWMCLLKTRSTYFLPSLLSFHNLSLLLIEVFALCWSNASVSSRCGFRYMLVQSHYQFGRCLWMATYVMEWIGLLLFISDIFLMGFEGGYNMKTNTFRHWCRVCVHAYTDLFACIHACTIVHRIFAASLNCSAEINWCVFSS